MGFIRIKTFDSVIEANISKAKLEDAGVLCYLKDENIIQINPLLSNLAGGIKLMVNRRDEALARILLNTAEDAYRKKLYCNSCMSANVHFVTSSRDKRNFFSILVSLATFTYPIYLRKKYVCDDCGYESDFSDTES